MMNETENVCASGQQSINIANHKKHLCDRLLVCMCVCMSERRSMCYMFTHVEVLCIFFFFFLFHRVLLLGNCRYALEFPSADGNGSVQPHTSTSPLSFGDATIS